MKRTANEKIGTTLRAMRTRRNLSLTDLSAATGIDASLLSRIETGVIADVKLRTIVKLATALDFRLDAFAAECGLGRPAAKLGGHPGLTGAELDAIIDDAQELVDTLGTLRRRTKTR